MFDDCAAWLRRWTIHVTHPRCFGLFHPRPTTAGILADELVEEGVASLPGRPAVYTGAEAHDSIVRVAQACGLGRAAVRRVPVDGDLRLDVRALSARTRGGT